MGREKGPRPIYFDPFAGASLLLSARPDLAGVSPLTDVMAEIARSC